ncbi:XrtA system polysaccharide chain length determinant [Kordiimonas pumila]|uniref:XrtA system polysaccharide chain length determinant n=1 Tax=Kordiimonas pumila TaxID=2161677 RepID=A0ABV7D224_9PROT|nr:XrtA system polysaccharide chain length determinant [Kordiimonas pumila]
MAAQALGLHEVFQQLKTIAYGIWRKRWYLLVTSWIISLLGWGLVSTMPYRYEANARIFVDADTILPMIAKNLGIDVDTTRKVDAIRRTLITRPNIEKIIRRSDYLDRLASNDALLTEMVASLQRDIRIIPLDDGEYRIQYEIDEKRLSDKQRSEVAKNVVNSLLSFFLEKGGESGGSDVRQGQEFLEQNIREYSDRLSSAEAAHAKFLQDNLEYVGGDSKFLTRLDNAKKDLRETRNKIGELRVSQQTLQEQLKNVPPTIREARSARTKNGGDRDPLQERLADLQKKLDQLRILGFRDMHPDVVNVSRQIDALKVEMEQQQAEVAAEIEDAVQTGRASNLTTETPNRLYEELMLQNVQTLTQIKSMEQREAEQINQVAELEEKAKRVPEIEAEESQLKRDYNLIRKTYESLQKQKQSLDLRADVEGADETVAFRVVEPPVAPKKPSGPPRLLFMSAVLVGALVAGIGVALVLSQLRPVIITVEQLRASFDLPVLGNVTRTLSEQETKQRSIDLLLFAGLSALLFIVFAVFLAMDILGGPSLG